MSAKRKPGKKGDKGKTVTDNSENVVDTDAVQADPAEGEEESNIVDIGIDPTDEAQEPDPESVPEVTPLQMEELLRHLQELQDQADADAGNRQDKEDSLLRIIAERDNQLRRLRRDQERDLAFAKGKLMAPLLDILDNFERALESVTEDEEGPFVEGMRLISTNLLATLATLGLREIQALGEKFDPQYHEALMQIKSDEAAKGTVAQVIQKGYLMDDQVLRPCKVAVAR